jgi:abequosyltransferase
MQNSIPLLTVAVPTYNRAPLLGRLLQQLEGEINNNPRVELVVSDNASDDGTPALVAKFQARGMRIRYLRNEANIGADRNIIQCFESASGEYVWVFSDDDVMALGTLDRLLEALSAQTYDLVFVTPYFFHGEYRKHKAFNRSRDLTLTRARDFARRVHVLLTFVSGLVLNKKRIAETPHRPYSTLFDTSLAQLGPVFTALNGHRKSLVIRDPLIAATANTRVGYPIYEVFGTNLNRIAHEWLSDPAVRKELFKGTLQRFFPFWIFKSRKQSASVVPENPHEVLRSCFGNYLDYWFFDYPVCALPLPLAYAWVTLLRALIKIEALLALSA